MIFSDDTVKPKGVSNFKFVSFCETDKGIRWFQAISVFFFVQSFMAQKWLFSCQNSSFAGFHSRDGCAQVCSSSCSEFDSHEVHILISLKFLPDDIICAYRQTNTQTDRPSSKLKIPWCSKNLAANICAELCNY